MNTAVVLIVKNEEQELPEWIAYHLAIGFGTVFVFDNASTDATTAVVRRFARHHDVRLINWDATDDRYQTRAYAYAIRTGRDEFDWIAFLDSDEFLVPDRDRTIPALLTAQPPDTAALALNWALFGSSGHIARPDGLVIANFLHRAPEDFPPNQHTKMIVRPRQVRACINPHFFETDGPCRLAAGDLATWTRPGMLDRRPDFAIARVNHYFIKSRDHWARKLARGYHDTQRPDWEFARYDQNQVEDRAILAWLDPTRATLARYR